jgi:acyl-CoA thioester hydrolase
MGISEGFATMSKILLHPCDKDDIIPFAKVEHPAPFQCKIETTSDQSSNEVNHINNIVYLQWIDKVAQLHCDSVGWNRERLLQRGVMWFVARHELDYLSEASSADELRITTWVENVRRVKSWRTTYVHSVEEESRIVCCCKTLWVLVHLETRRPKSIPVEMAETLDSLTPPKGISGANA